jgi:hypothetical protein
MSIPITTAVGMIQAKPGVRRSAIVRGTANAMHALANADVAIQPYHKITTPSLSLRRKWNSLTSG